MKRILGLDLGTTSIGWAFVNESENKNETSSIIKTGVRVVPLSTDEQNDFKKGNSITTNANRTEKRGARRNLFRYKLRREDLINILKEIDFINDETALAENDKNTTHSTHELRAKAVSEKIGKEELARVLLIINKKRGYKSNRKVNDGEDGELIDGMEVTKKLHNQNLTPGQFSFKLLQNGKKALPDYYRSDLQDEFKKIWDFQKQFYSDSLTEAHFKELQDKNKNDTSNYFKNKMLLDRVELKGKRDEKKLQTFELRSKAVSEQLTPAEIAHVLTELNNEINKSSGYLGGISDRSKELYFNDQTVGQYQYEQLKENPHNSLKNQVFYRQDYVDEFERIWAEQSKHYPELTDKLKEKVQDTIIFYQRRLKSQKGLISYCEFESWEQDVVIDGVKKRKTIGQRVVPKSSLLFQQFKIWQIINSLVLTNESNEKGLFDDPKSILDEETKKALFEELNWTNRWTSTELLKWLSKNTDMGSPKNWSVNFQHIEGNRTNDELLKAYQKILFLEGYEIDFKKLNAEETVQSLKDCFKTIGIDTRILDFDFSLQGNDFAKQPSYELWHLLYSYENDNSKTGNEKLIERLQSNFGFKPEYATILANIGFQDDYGNLSARAIRKILPHLQDGLKYPDACEMAGYNHSSSVTAEENTNRELDDKLEILKKNSLRNPVVGKILNQMINVVNAILEDENLGRPDEIRIELAREMKKTAEQRKDMTLAISKTTKAHEEYREIIKEKFGLRYVSRNDLIKYKLYRELEVNGHKTLYSGTYINPDELFTNKFDVEHIIPKSRLFDDSFSNKTLETRQDNIDKGNETALDFVERKYGDKGLEQYKNRVGNLWKEKKISYTKHKKLLMSVDEIPEDFLARDLGTTAYIARESMKVLKPITRKTVLTSGTITDKLRDDWGLIKVLQELNWDKYERVGMTYHITNKEGKQLPRIEDWTKRNDHRHHAMDAIAVAFTRQAFIQYLNNLNAKSTKGWNEQGIEEKYTYKNKRGKRKFKAPFENIREQAKKHLEEILVSHKAKNKVTTNNKNKIKVKGKGRYKYKIEQTPRGQLHKETIYGKSKYYATKMEKVGSKFDNETIDLVANKKYREALQKRLEEFEGNPKKAFAGKNSPAKNPIYLNGTQESVPEKVKLVWLEDQYTIRKDITPDLKLDKVVDAGAKKILQERLKEFNNKPKEAFANLDENPIWINEEKGIQLKRVTITGVRNAESIHHKKNNLGEEIFDKNGNIIESSFVELGNNHHIAIYRDKDGNLQEEVVSFYEAVFRKKSEQPIIDKNHPKGWKFLFSMKQNEMFIFPPNHTDFLEIDLKSKENKALISPYLFRVQSISSRYYIFRHHLETRVANGNTFKHQKQLSEKTFHFYQSEKNLEGIIKVRINHLGDIVHIGEY